MNLLQNASCLTVLKLAGEFAAFIGFFSAVKQKYIASKSQYWIYFKKSVNRCM